ncbi:ER membrane protein complex subunit 10 [Melospiza melodia melodia]|uniref:ER membrane protein complex subunit 10 n=1 Tax=Melospiza melodia melodia TaxID=1914991 RepID=UPI002FD4073D
MSLGGPRPSPVATPIRSSPAHSRQHSQFVVATPNRCSPAPFPPCPALQDGGAVAAAGAGAAGGGGGAGRGGGLCRGGTGTGTGTRASDTESCRVSLTLEHSFELDDVPRFRRRGSLSLSWGPEPALALAQKPLGEEERARLREVAAQDGLYRVRVPAIPPGPGEDGDTEFVTSFVRATRPGPTRCLPRPYREPIG